MKNIIVFVVLSFLASCAVSEETSAETLTLRVNSYTVECVGEVEGRCLLVQEGSAIGTEDWEYFYFQDGIEGFNYEPGYVYDLLVRKIPVKEPPMDGSSIHYKLIRILEKVEQ